MEIQVKVGDVFLVLLVGIGWAIGQLISDYKGDLYVAIFGQRVKRPMWIRIVLLLQSEFFGAKADAKLFHGDWPIMGNVQKNLTSFPQPAFKVLQSGVTYIESRDQMFSRPASASEVNLLIYRSISSPAVIENAVRAHLGIGDWSPHYDEFAANFAITSSKLL